MTETGKNIIEHSSKKVMSGKLWLAGVAGACLIMMVRSGEVTPSEILPIITMVFMSYFNKKEA